MFGETTWWIYMCYFLLCGWADHTTISLLKIWTCHRCSYSPNCSCSCLHLFSSCISNKQGRLIYAMIYVNFPSSWKLSFRIVCQLRSEFDYHVGFGTIVFYFSNSFSFCGFQLLDFLLGHGNRALFRRAELKTLVNLHGNEVINWSYVVDTVMCLCF